MIVDYKTKWDWYDLRISVRGTKQMVDLADAIAHYFYNQNRRKDLAERIKKLDPNTNYDSGYSIKMLEEELNKLEIKK